jgi:hypothetical protein
MTVYCNAYKCIYNECGKCETGKIDLYCPDSKTSRFMCCETFIERKEVEGK